MKNSWTKLYIALIALLFSTNAIHAQPSPLPTVPREMRGIWIATVGIDWPTRSDPPATQRTKLIAILDKAAELNTNVIVFQIRPGCDALYASEIEPWSYYLTGLEGRAPSPLWDPLQFAIDECRKRGMELHAWFNPYRAGFTNRTYAAPTHIRSERPDLVRTYGSYYWLDPGHPDVQQYSLSVFMDVVNRYDIDGVHIDDYFYPYPVSGTPFPDDTTYAQYGGGLSRSDWRRKNVDDFVKLIYESIKAAKPHVKFGISPFGIWRPGNPSGIVGLDAYASLYADSKKWFNNGWCDYFTPQLYWQIHDTGQEYPKLLDWWISQNTRGRHLAPGLFTGRVAYGNTPYWPASDIVDQVVMTQGRAGAVGNIHFSARAFTASGGAGGDGLNDKLKTAAYIKESLVPAATWLDNTPPSMPNVSFIRHTASQQWDVSWSNAGAESARWWVLYYYRNGAWTYDILPATTLTMRLPGTGASIPTWAAVTAVDRLGNASSPRYVQLQDPPTPTPQPTPSPSPSPEFRGWVTQ